MIQHQNFLNVGHSTVVANESATSTGDPRGIIKDTKPLGPIEVMIYRLKLVVRLDGLLKVDDMFRLSTVSEEQRAETTTHVIYHLGSIKIEEDTTLGLMFGAILSRLFFSTMSHDVVTRLIWLSSSRIYH